MIGFVCGIVATVFVEALVMICVYRAMTLKGLR